VKAMFYLRGLINFACIIYIF